MPAHSGGLPRRALLGLTAGFLLAWAAPGYGETLEQIEGLSVKVDSRVQFMALIGQSWRPATGEGSTHLYISTKGNVFQYSRKASMHSPTGEELHAGGGRRTTAIDKAAETKSGQLVAWTMTNGHLTGITKLIHGYAVTTIAIDPVQLTCTFDRQHQPDPQTGTIVTNTTGQPVQIEAYKVMSYSCDVKKGNVFASDSE